MLCGSLKNCLTFNQLTRRKKMSKSDSSMVMREDNLIQIAGVIDAAEAEMLQECGKLAKAKYPS